MPYEIVIPDKIQRILDKKLDKHLKERLYKKLLKLEIAPHSHAKPLRPPLAGIWEIYFEKDGECFLRYMKAKIYLLLLDLSIKTK